MGAAVKMLMLLALLQMAESVPAPDPDPIIVQVIQDVDSGCGIGGCPPKECCIFGTKTYQHNDIINAECLKMKCCDGTWEYISIDTTCGTCNVEGDPHITSFDKSVGPDNDEIKSPIVPKYRLQGEDEYVITQHGLKTPSFGVTGTFKKCNGDESCIEDITYYEPGIKIKIKVPPIPTIVVNSDTPEIVIPPGSSQVFFGNPGGAIVVFRHAHMIDSSLGCISILGTKGYSVTLCQELKNYPFLYIRAATSLQKELYGLCNIYTGTGTPATKFMGGPKNPGAFTDQASDVCLTEYSNPPTGRLYDICTDFSKTWIV